MRKNEARREEKTPGEGREEGDVELDPYVELLYPDGSLEALEVLDEVLL